MSECVIADLGVCTKNDPTTLILVFAGVNIYDDYHAILGFRRKYATLLCLSEHNKNTTLLGI